MQRFQERIHHYIHQIKNIPTGFKRVFLESKEVYSILNAKKTVNPPKPGSHPYNRREHELIRAHFASIRKLGLFFVLQLPPIIGLVPITFAILYPKQMLTYHFWSNEQKVQFLEEEYNERREFSKNIIALYPHPLSSSSSEHKDSTGSYSLLVTFDQWYNHLHREYLPVPINDNGTAIKTNTVYSIAKRDFTEYLAGSHAICDAKSSIAMTPSILLRIWLSQRVREIVHDDILLLQDGLDDMSVDELQQALLRRGFNPIFRKKGRDNLYLSTSHDDPDYKQYLKKLLKLWLEVMVTESDRTNIVAHERYFLYDLYKSRTSAMLHLIAYNLTLDCQILLDEEKNVSSSSNA